MDSTLVVILLICALIFLALLFFALALIMVWMMRKANSEEIKQMFETFNDINMRLVAANTELTSGVVLTDNDIRAQNEDITKAHPEAFRAAISKEPSQPFDPFSYANPNGDSNPVENLNEKIDVTQQTPKAPVKE